MNKVDGQEQLLNLKREKDLSRQGITFHTRANSYLYDTGTGKVVQLEDATAPIIDALFNKDIGQDEFKELICNKELADSIAEFLEGEHLLRNPEIIHFVDMKPFMSEDALACEQLIIELTGRCNLRCRYCTYGEHYEGTREFTSEDISFATAKKAIDYAYRHRNMEMFAVTFYGGEPLINFGVMKQCIDYCVTAYSETKIDFSFTTNLTLMTREIAEYLVQIPNMNIVVSIDGPENIQNKSRVFANKKPSFDAAYRGLKQLCDAIKKFDSKTQLLFSSVFMPPFTAERFDAINDFFESLDFLPEGTTVSATYPAPGSIPDSVFEELREQNYDSSQDISWVDWAINKVEASNDLPQSPNLYTVFLQQLLVAIHQRRLVNEPMDKYPYNACCIPIQRRLYVCTDGTYKICEKIGDSPGIGSVETGLDFDAISEYYLKQYESRSMNDCSKCWAVTLCDICYAECYNENGLDLEKKRQLCKVTRDSALNRLCVYHDIMERYPDIIKLISTIERH